MGILARAARSVVLGCVVARAWVTVVARAGVAIVAFVVLVASISNEQSQAEGFDSTLHRFPDRTSVGVALPEPSDGCRPRRPDEFVPVLQVVRLDASVTRMGFDEAWRRVHNDARHDDVWVIGVCPGSR